MQNLRTNNIEKLLKEAGLINEGQLNEISSIKEVTGENVEKLMLSEEFINRKEILSSMAKKMGVESVDLENTTVNKKCD